MHLVNRLTLLMAIAAPSAFAAEGMWTLDSLPRAAMQERYGFSPDQAWVDKVMRASVRLANGCSGSFVSGKGLVMTNAHCVVGCVNQLSSEQRNLLADGFVANRTEQELSCDMELNTLQQITDVTARIAKATAGKQGEAFAEARQAEQTRIESECVGKDGARVRCDVVELYQGGIQHLYRYRRYQDVRLVFTPEYDTAFFGGDPDNFNFPRFNLDFALLRAYENGKPVKSREFFTFNPEGAEVGELVMVTGHPGTTERQLTVSQLEFLRDWWLIERTLSVAEYRGLLLRFAAESEENKRISQSAVLSTENALKVYRNELLSLHDDAVLSRKGAEEAELRAFVDADPDRKARWGSAWDEVAAAVVRSRELMPEYDLLEFGRGFMGSHFTHARNLLRGTAERALPDAERLPEYTEGALPTVVQALNSKAPLYPHYETLRLGWSLSKLRERLGADHPLARQLFAKESPEALAARLVSGTRLGDPAVRMALWEGGADAVKASKDPMIELARSIDGTARALRKRYEAEVEAVENRAAESIAQARFAAFGTRVYPDATFTLRLSYGEVAGWREGGGDVPAFTNAAGLFARTTGYAPFALPQRWTERKERLPTDTRINFVSTNDITGGNSGSPVINARAEVVGLAFDGNIHSIGGAYGFDERVNRTVSVHPQFMLGALREIYDAGPLADEIMGKR